MSNFKILADSCCDIPDDILNKIDVDIIPYYTCIDSKNHLRERLDITIDEFYSQLNLNKNLFPKTSFPPLYEFEKFFRSYLDKNLDILFISMTEKFSSAFQALNNMVENLEDEYPNLNIILVDSMQVSMGEGLLIIEAAKMKKAGYSIFEIADFINKSKYDSKLFCTVNSLDYLQKGGRIGKVSAIAGSLLNIKPIISMKNGELFPYSKVHGRKKAVEELINLIAKATQNQKNDYEFALMHSSQDDEVNEIINTLKNKFDISLALPPVKVGSIIGSHIGPTVLALTAVKKFS